MFRSNLFLQIAQQAIGCDAECRGQPAKDFDRRRRFLSFDLSNIPHAQIRHIGQFLLTELQSNAEAADIRGDECGKVHIAKRARMPLGL